MDDSLVIEEDDLSEDEDDDNEVLRDDSLPVCTPKKVHDVKLGDVAEDGTSVSAASGSQNNTASASSNIAATLRGMGSGEFRSGSSFGPKGTMSFAAAAMAGLTSASGRAVRKGKDRGGLVGSSSDPPKLIFSAGRK